MSRIVIGIDAGGTSTRCLAVDLRGAQVGWARGPGGNLNSSADAAGAWQSVLTDVAPAGSRLEAVVVAAAGAGPAGRARALEAACAATETHDVGVLLVHSDIEAAFAAGSPTSDGTVLIAGTGAVAATVRDFRVHRRRDGHGYLLGDRGSAFWIGSQAARAALAALDGTGEPTGLTRLVSDHALRDEPPAGAEELYPAELIEAATYAHPPAWLGTLAPLVESAADSGDPVARRIADAAIAALVETAAAVDEGGSLVVTGGVAGGGGTLGRTIRDALAVRLGRTPVLVHDGSVGAAALALRAVDGVDESAVRALISQS